MPIQLLSPQLANQIAAGEVVERPASVVKELIENSIDAGANRIEIDIEQGGAKLIRIRDNGSGIAADELKLALMRHATSKIRTLDDLQAIHSLGFRGEALASISSVARLTLTSCAAGQSQAWQAYTEGRDMQVTVKPAAHPPGTTLEVRDLFYNTPARRRFLRTEKTEFMHVDEVVRRIALARFDVSLNLQHNGKTVRQYRAVSPQLSGDRRLEAICGAAFVREALELDWRQGDLSLTGWLSLPARNGGDAVQYSYVNGRMMRDRLMAHAIRQACNESAPDGAEPSWVLFLSVDPQQVDVNVHPAKQEVRFHQSRLVHDFVCQGVMNVLQTHPLNRTAPLPAIPAVTTARQTRTAAGHHPFAQGAAPLAEHHTPARQQPGEPHTETATAFTAPLANSSDQPASASSSVSLREPAAPAYTVTGKHSDAMPPADIRTNNIAARPVTANNRLHQPYDKPRYQPRQAALYGQMLANAVPPEATPSSDATTPGPHSAIHAIAVPAAVARPSAGFGRVLAIVRQQFALLERDGEVLLLNLTQAAARWYQAQLCGEDGDSPVSDRQDSAITSAAQPAGAQKSRAAIPSQPLSIPFRLRISAIERARLSAAQAGLAQMGIELATEHDYLTISALPLPLRQQNLHLLIPDLIGYLTQQTPADSHPDTAVNHLANQSVDQPVDPSAGDKTAHKTHPAGHPDQPAFDFIATVNWLAWRLTDPQQVWTVAQAISLLANLERCCGSLAQSPPSVLLCAVDFQPVISVLANE